MVQMVGVPVLDVSIFYYDNTEFH